MIDVAIAVIQDNQQRVLLTRRQSDKDFAGDWEFPGGKQEEGEHIEQALSRELYEELGLSVTQYQRMMTIPWHYAHKTVRLHVYMITAWQGEPTPKQGQPMRWFELSEIAQLNMPPANQGIKMALILPKLYAITGKFDDLDQLESGVEYALSQGVGIVQLRTTLDDQAYIAAAQRILPLVKEEGAKLLLNTSFENWLKVPGTGLHLSSEKAAACHARPVPASVLFSVSVHNLDQLKHAQAIGADCVLLSPVLPTQTHPDEPALGWDNAGTLADMAAVPVYALGGVDDTHLVQARDHGMQGVAGIGAFWPKKVP